MALLAAESVILEGANSELTTGRHLSGDFSFGKAEARGSCQRSSGMLMLAGWRWSGRCGM